MMTKKPQELYLSTCIQLHILKQFPEVINFRHLFGCATCGTLDLG